MLHHFARQRNRVLDVPNTGYRTCCQVTTIHNGSIQVIHPFLGEYGTAAGIEQRIIFQCSNGGYHGINWERALFQYLTFWMFAITCTVLTALGPGFTCSCLSLAQAA